MWLAAAAQRTRRIRLAERFDEALDVLLRAWTGERFSYAGKYHDVRDVRFNVCPVQRMARHVVPAFR